MYSFIYIILHHHSAYHSHYFLFALIYIKAYIQTLLFTPPFIFNHKLYKLYNIIIIQSKIKIIIKLQMTPQISNK